MFTAAPEPGSTEQVYYYELHAGSAAIRRTLAMLRNQAGDKGVVLRFRQRPASRVYALEEHRRTARRLRDGPRAGDELSRTPGRSRRPATGS